MLFSLLSWLPIHSGHSVRNQDYSRSSQLQNEKTRKKYRSRFIAPPVGYLREWSVHCCSYEYDLATMLWGGKHIHLMGSRGIHQIEWIAKLHSCFFTSMWDPIASTAARDALIKSSSSEPLLLYLPTHWNWHNHGCHKPSCYTCYPCLGQCLCV